MGFKQDSQRNFMNNAAATPATVTRRVQISKFTFEFSTELDVFSWSRYAATRLRQFDLAQTADTADAHCFAANIRT